VSSGQDKDSKDEVKGFAGLSSMVSDVDVPPAGDSRSSGTKPTTSESPPSRVPPAEQSQPRAPTYQQPAQPPGSGAGTKWAIGIAVVGGLIWLVSLSDKQSTSTPTPYPPTSSSPATQSSPSILPPTPQVQTSARPTEERPPVGTGNVLGAPQIRYCVAEDIRLDAAKNVINQYNDSDIDRFNALVADYNSRCSNFRYRRGALESAKSDVERYRTEIAAEGRSAFVRSTPTPRAQKAPAPSRSIPLPQGRQSEQPEFPGVQGAAPSVRSARQCTYSTECSGSNQCLDGQCRPPRVGGERCAYSSECAGANQCLEGMCRPARSSGERCSYSSECSGANQCLDGQCRPARSGGERCSYSSECSGANQCLDGQCRPPRVTGERCAYSSECGGMNECVLGRCQRPQ